jgi:hypothetical protein
VNAPEQGFQELLDAARDAGRREIRDALETLVADWEATAAKAHPDWGPQMVSVAFAAAEIRRAYGGVSPVGLEAPGTRPSSPGVTPTNPAGSPSDRPVGVGSGRSIPTSPATSATPTGPLWHDPKTPRRARGCDCPRCSL